MSASFSRDKIIFTIGRMNPPTSGHQSLIRAMMEEAVCSNVGVVYVILSSSLDKIKNPLKCSRKKELLVGGVSNVVEDLKRKWIADVSMDKGVVEKIRDCQVRVICMNEPEITTVKYGWNPILKCLGYLLDKWEGGYWKKEGWLFVGEDRIGDYRWISEYVSKRMSSLTIVPVSRPSGGISSTYVRGFVMDGKRDEFLGEMTTIGIVGEKAEKVYWEIRRALGKKRDCKKSLSSCSERSKTSKKTRNYQVSSIEDSIGSRTRSATRRKEGL
jgi:nicotinamide mononucleotide adenylyltransferase